MITILLKYTKNFNNNVFKIVEAFNNNIIIININNKTFELKHFINI